MAELDKDKEIVEYCQVGLRGYIAARILKQNGFKVNNITGGYKSASTLNIKLDKKDMSITTNGCIDSDTQTVRCN